MNGQQILVVATLVLSSFATTRTPGFAQDRPGAPHLFPHDVLAYARVDDMQRLRQAAGESSFAKMLNDPQLKPLAGELYLTVAELFDSVSDQFGITLDELLNIPQGEVAFAVVPFDAAQQDDTVDDDDSPEAIRQRLQSRRRRSGSIGLIGLLETKENSPLLQNLLDAMADLLRNQGYVTLYNDVAETTITTYRGPDANRPAVEYCQVDGVTVLGVGEGVVAETLRRWKIGPQGTSLAQNDDFGAVLTPCVGAEETRPQLTFFVNPHGIVERVIKSRGGAAALFWPIIEDLGLGKLRGVGGSVFTGGEVFESIFHVHMLIKKPRDGFFAVVRPDSGDIHPPAWVPDDVSSYTTVSWDIANSYAGLGRILERFQGENALQRLAEEPIMRQTDVDLQSEVIDLMTGRVVVMRWYEPPARINSQTLLVGIEVKDGAQAVEVLEKLADAFPSRMVRRDQGSVIVYHGSGPPADRFPEGRRLPDPRVALLDNFILMTDSPQLLERAMRTNVGALPKLERIPDFEIVANEVAGKLDGDPPFLFGFSRAQQLLRQFYEMAEAPNMRQRLRDGGSGNPALGRLSAVLDKHDLPPFDLIAKYFEPSGDFAYDSPSGLHYTTFTLKSQR